MNNNILDYKKCSNCGACYNACPTKAITVDENGLFYKIKVKESLCINCGKCKKVCPVNQPIKSQKTTKAYGAFSNNPEIVQNSSSGGLFYTFAKRIVEEGGIVFSAAFYEDYKSVVIANTDNVELEDLMRSKYVESKVGNSFINIKDELDKGRLVLFCGSPCQAAGLKRYLGKDYPKLYICDFSCGGFPSHTIYRDHILELEKTYKSETESVNFRKKVNGWSTSHRLYVRFRNGKEYLNPADFDYYLFNFLKHHSIRDYCCECDFADNHYSDIVLADFWLYKEFENIPTNKSGLSLVIINSEQGQKLFDSVSDRITVYNIDLVKASYNLRRRAYKDKTVQDRIKFLDNYSKFGIKIATQKAGIPTGLSLIYWRLRYKAAEIWRYIK